MKLLEPVFFLAASCIWSSVNALARALRNFLGGPPQRLHAGFVISIGNLQAGGAGKTPLVARIAGECVSEGLSVAILCRGYGGLLESTGGTIAPGNQPADPREVGDEAALLHALVPEAWVGVGADRFESCARIAELAGARPDVVLLDDGFQHFKVHRDIDVLAVTSHSPWTRIHRDFVRRAADADVVVWTKGESPPPSLRHASSPVLRARFRLEPPDPARRERRHWLVTGVGDPAQACHALETAGFRIARQTTFRDHATYAPEWIEDCLQKASRDGLRVLTTGKDAVKWKALGISPMRFDEREPEIEFIGDGEEQWRGHFCRWVGVVRSLDKRS